MKKHMGLIVLAVLVVLGLLTYMVSYRVESTDLSLVLTLGGKVDRSAVYDGRLPGQAGLKFKWPWMKHVHYDARVFQFEDTLSEIQTRDEQNILITVFCQWQVADAVRFYAKTKSIASAEGNIRRTLRSIKGGVMGRYDMEDFINTDPSRMKITQIEEEIGDGLREVMDETYGVRIVMVGVKALGLPESVTETVIEVMKEDRQEEIEMYDADGKAMAEAIKSRAKSDSDTILAFALFTAENIKTEGYGQAARRYEQYGQDPEFAMFLRSLESLRRELASQTVILLDGSKIEAVKFFQKGPAVPSKGR
ncbi:hypothetical protein LCGC14_0368880 [marine sediment metagenome]|uniref:Band 7 domain-containing protein n=1 Tax=marine sediment metagenome TaxID=412755 RepID=A0A0F9VSZ8_9ZZZZ|nr:hypothetical protein [Phycisphaerae bacterium]HDZ42591.1 hypothetical protein [Phycisphaerae bacterium]